MTRDPRRAYRVVDQFEAELCDYTGAPYCVAVDSCTNALFLSLLLEAPNYVTLPRRTYVGVLQAVLNTKSSGHRWADFDWQQYGSYQLAPSRIIDSARRIGRQMYQPNTLTCLSFHAAKQLPLGRGGAILTDDPAADQWLRRARADGRQPGDGDPYATYPGHHMYLPPDTAARGLWILSRWNDTNHTPAPLPPDNYPDLSAL